MNSISRQANSTHFLDSQFASENIFCRIIENQITALRAIMQFLNQLSFFFLADFNNVELVQAAGKPPTYPLQAVYTGNIFH